MGRSDRTKLGLPYSQILQFVRFIKVHNVRVAEEKLAEAARQ